MIKSSHVVGTRNDRLRKAANIAYALAPERTDLRVLDVGTGTGWIAHHLAASKRFEAVFSVDVRDERAVTEGFEFRTYDSGNLPFGDQAFDLVVLNHVLEHVGPEADQVAFLMEVRRVLKVGGRAYLACPSRWHLVEPHFRLPLLSLMPRKWASWWVGRRGRHFDVWNPGPLALDGIIRRAGFSESSKALVLAECLIRGKPRLHFARRLERLFRLITPTHVRVLTKDS